MRLEFELTHTMVGSVMRCCSHRYRGKCRNFTSSGRHRAFHFHCCKCSGLELALVGITALKNRTLSPLADLFIKTTRAVASPRLKVK